MTIDPAVVEPSSGGHAETQVTRLDDDALLDLPYSAAKELTLKAFEQRYLTALLDRAHGSISAAARLAHLDRSNFRRLLRRHGLRGHAAEHEHELEHEHDEHVTPVPAPAPSYPGRASPLAAETRRA